MVWSISIPNGYASRVKRISTDQIITMPIVLGKEKLYSFHNVFVLMLLKVLQAPFELITSTLLNSLQSLDQSYLARFQFFTCGRKCLRINLLSKILSSSS